MINLKKAIDNFEKFFHLLLLRGVDIKNIEIIKNLLKKRNDKIKLINFFGKEKNEINKKKREKNDSFKENVKKIKAELNDIEAEINSILLNIPNVPHTSVPNDDEGNRVIKEKFFNHEIKHSLESHEILKSLEMIDEKRAVKISGSRFVIYRKKGAEIFNFLVKEMNEINKEDGYELIISPYIINEKSLYNTGQLPKFRGDLFEIKEKNSFLIPTSEVALINMYSEETINIDQIPLKLTSYTQCFRSEAGALGKDNKGIIRLHQFNKVEIVCITSPENSYEWLEKMTFTACKILEKLKITYRIILLCYKEMSFTSSKTYDIEVWMPVSKRWLEISSCSNCEDFQSMRSQIKIQEGKDKYFAHTLNASSLAVDRLIAVVSEYYYDEKKKDIIF